MAVALIMEALSQPTFPFALTFDDILLLPGYSDFTRGDIDLSTQLTRKINLKIPFVSAPMDTVTEEKLAIALGQVGGIGIIHRNLRIEDQADMIRTVKNKDLLVGGAVSGGRDLKERSEALVKAGVDVVIVDSAHGYAKNIIEATTWLKKTFQDLEVIAGNIATHDAAIALIDAGADALRVGMGPGAICTTRVISGMGVPQVTALQETVRAARPKQIPVIADGGMRYSGDFVKALALGASTIMMGSFFASAQESPGKIVELRRDQVPHRFLSVFNSHKQVVAFKEYRGMGSVEAMQKGAEIKSGDEFHGKDYYNDKALVPEGVSGLVPIKGSVADLIDQAIGGIKSGMYYTASKTIKDMWKKAQFIQVTQASLAESHPHDILVVNPGDNYS